MSKTYDSYISEIDTKVDEVIHQAQVYMSPKISKQIVEDEIKRAYEYAKEAHKSQSRLSGEPYINHPTEAVKILMTLTPDIETIQACFLHDVIEDTEISSEDIKSEFGEEVLFLCEWMEKLTKVKYKWEERAIGSLRKMFVAMAEDVRVIFIKLSDRLHNMRTLHHHPKPDKRKRIAEETLNIYSPIAGRLGLYNLKNSLEEECFKILEPEKYKTIKSEVETLKGRKKDFQSTAVAEMKKILDEIWIESEVDFRIKSIYSIHKKLVRKGFESVSDLYDIYGIRIIVYNISDCYRVLWEIHSRWHTLPYRFKDYIALPKPNGYRSLHTTVIGFLKRHTTQPTEIQIRTPDMHKRAEIGVAAHFEYKEKGSKIATEIDWVWELKDLVDSIGNNELVPSLAIDVFKHRIYVFTPKWDAINLPSGSCPIDFAYSVHTDLWDHVSLAKVNNTISPLDRELKNGDIVEVIIDKNKKPSPFWLSFVKTVKAKNSIKSFLRKWNKELHRDRGKEILNRYLEKTGLDALDKDMTVLKILDGREFNVEERLQLLEQVWNFSITPASLLRRILRQLKIRPESQRKSKTLPQKIKGYFDSSSSNNTDKDIVIGGEKGLDYRVCKDCCSKYIPDQIVAHINSKWTFVIHKRSCKILKWVNAERLIPAFIEGNENDTIFFKLNFFLKNKVWALKIISETLFSMGINIDEIHSKKLSAKETKVTLSIEVLDYDYLIIDRLVERFKIALWDMLLEYEVDELEYS